MVPVEEAGTESSEVGVEQECPRRVHLWAVRMVEQGPLGSLSYVYVVFLLCAFYLAGSGAASDW